MNTLILITGFARCGKDTLADGIVKGSKNLVVKMSFADELRRRCDLFLTQLGLSGDDGPSFFEEGFKIRNRHFLVSAGVLARSIDKDYWANVVVDNCAKYENNGKVTIVVPDWRYMNEKLVADRKLPGWKIVTVRVHTVGEDPANQEEAISIGEITRSLACDYEYWFAPSSADKIRKQGQDLARILVI